MARSRTAFLVAVTFAIGLDKSVKASQKCSTSDPSLAEWIRTKQRLAEVL